MPPEPHKSGQEQEDSDSWTVPSYQSRSSRVQVRTVNDFETVRSLRSALENVSQQGDTSCARCVVWGTSFDDDNEDTNKRNGQYIPSSDLDWVTENLDMKKSRAQSVDEEMDRLLVLKSYMILDSDPNKHFERLTGIASRVFDVPISLVSLVDLGRQWFMSNHGLGDVRETPRKMAFCSHAIQSAEDLFIVPDATKDRRFENNPLVTGHPHIRFYAGAPLLTSEGYKLGTLCIIDRKPRPRGLTISEKQTLFELSALAMEEMERLKEERTQLAHDKSKVLACQAHDLMTPLEGAERALSQLEDFDRVSQSNAGVVVERKELLKNVSTCVKAMRRICLDALDDVSDPGEAIESIRHMSDCDPGSDKKKVGNDEICKKDDSQECSDLKRPARSDVCQIPLLVQRIRSVMSTYPKTVPLVISVDPKVPEMIISDELKIFRSALNYVTNALDRTKTGSVELCVTLKEIKKATRFDTNANLVFECKDTRPGINSEMLCDLFRPTGRTDDDRCSKPATSRSGLGLFSVASSISSLGGTYGFYPRKAEGDPMVTKHNGAVFWFSVPLVVPYSSGMEQLGRGEALRSGTEQTPARLSSETQRVKMLSMSNMEDSDSKHVYDVVSNTMQTGSEDTGIISRGANKSTPGDLVVKKQALVMDDSPVVRKNISHALRSLGFDVKLATNGMEGLKMLQSSHYDVVFCDVLMPYMDGLECVEQYRAWENKHRPSFRQHIIALTADDSEDVMKKGMDVGMDGFVPKSRKLSEALSKALALANLPDDENCRLDERSTSRRKIRWREMTGGGFDMSLTSMALHSAHPSLSPAKRAAFSAGFTSLASPRCSGGNRQEVSVSQGASDRLISSLVRSNNTGDTMIEPMGLRDNAPSYECLIAEDSLSAAKIMVKVIEEKKGWKAKVVNDGEDALYLLKKRQWDAVLIDEDLPSESGTNCMARFRVWETGQNRAERQKNVFLISAHFSSQQSRRFSAVPSGFDGWFGKPVRHQDVANALHRAVQNM